MSKINLYTLCWVQQNGSFILLHWHDRFIDHHTSLTNLNSNVNKLNSAPREIMLVENNNDVFASAENIIVNL